MDINFPDDLLYQILIKLPVTSLLRFRCVSKPWCSLIATSDFNLHHLDQNHEVGKYNVLFRKYLPRSDVEVYSLHSDNLNFDDIETLDCPFRGSADYLSVIGCVNGVICLWDESPFNLMFWNPSIRKCFTIPDVVKIVKGIRVRQSVIRDMCFGFGYDALSNDYKVVRIIFYNKAMDDGTVTFIDTVHDTSVFVYSLRRRLWRKVNYTAPLRIYSRSCSVGGFVYRLTQIDRYGFEIVSFNLNSEKFTEVACPEEVKSVLRCKTELTIFREYLGLLHEWDCKRYHIWVMKEGGVAKSWTKLFSVDLDREVPVHRIVGFTMKGLMLVVGEGSLVVSPVVEDVKVVNYVPSGPQTETAWHMESYKESLVLFNEGDNVPSSALNLGCGNQTGSSAKALQH